MATIQPTRIGTSYTRSGGTDGIDICDGVPLLPQIGALQAGTSFSYRDPVRILAVSPKRILLWRLSGNVGYQLVAGVCGPAYAATFMVEGETRGREVNLRVSQDEAAAGVFAGVRVDFPGKFQVDAGSPRWTYKKGFYLKWSTAFRKTFTPSIDILGLLIEIIRKLMKEMSKNSEIKEGEELEGEPRENKEEEKKPEPRPKPSVRVKSWGMFDKTDNTFNGNKGVISPEPTLTLIVDLVPLWPELVAVDKGLKALWGGLSLGPKFHFIVPVHIRFKRVQLDEAEVRSLEYRDGGLTGTLDQAVDTVTRMQVDMDHNPTLTFGTSFYLSLSVCKVFSFDPESPMLRLDRVLGVEVSGGHYCNGFVNAVGVETSPADPLVRCGDSSIAVILDP